MIFMFAMLVNGGCGGGIQVINYYYYPNWTPDGKIICSKEYAEHKDLGFGKWQQIKTEYYLTVMDEDGSNESNIKQINETAKISYSPLGNYIAYTEGDYIKIINPDGTDVGSIDAGATVDSIAWSSDEAKVVYGITTSTTSEIYIVDRDGDNKEFLSVGQDVAWKYGSEIFFEHKIGIYYYLGSISPNRSNFADYQLNSVYSPAISPANPVLIYGKKSGNYQVLNKSNMELTTLFENFTGYLPKISPDELKVTYGKVNDSGMWVINIDGINLKQIR